MDVNGFDIIDLPDDALPTIEELSGDLRLLAEIIDVRSALRVAQVIDGTPLRIYSGRSWVRRLRDNCMRREYDKGVTVIALARKYSISERQVYNILGQAGVDKRQMKMW